jgi:predicted GNAT family acetyltransferase
MKVTRHPSAGELFRHAGPFLESSEAENALLIGIVTAPVTPPDGLWMSVENDSTSERSERGVLTGGPASVAVRTPPFNLVLSRAPRGALAALAETLSRDGEVLPGVVGRTDAAEAFAELWVSGRPELRAQTLMRQGLYRLRRVIPPSRVPPGGMRLAAAGDVGLVTEWSGQFSVDANLPAAEYEAFRQRAAGRVAQNAIFLWEERRGGPVVSMAALVGPTKHGVRVGMVYTPAALRRRGYASALVAALSAHALASGRHFCILYTDLANPTSNAIYQQVGYELVCDWVMIDFLPRTPPGA